jgi:hypothetical protein
MTGFLFIAPYTVADAFIVTLWLLYKCFAHTERAWKFSRTEPNNPALMEHEILLEMSKLLEKTGMDNVIPVVPASTANEARFLETTLVNIKNFNARYEKAEALNQVQWLMNTYNIQIDELMERIGS